MVDSGGNQRTLVAHSVLIGLTPLIPIPLADDLVKGYFMRRLIRALADSYGLDLSGDVVEALSRDRGAGYLSGCLVQVLLYPLKRIFRKIFYFLEWKRAVDLTSYTYYYGYLLDYALMLAQNRTSASTYTRGHEKTYLCASDLGRRA